MQSRTCYSNNLLLCTVLLAIVEYSCYQNDEYRKPRFDNRQLNVTAIAGETISLPCSVENKTNRTITWMNPKKIVISHGDRRLMDDIRMTIERPMVPDWNLHIRNVRFSDRGMYLCTLNTKPVLVKRIHLNVLVPPDINEYWSSQNQVVREGATVQLTCNATGRPTPEIRWYRKTVYSQDGQKDAIGTPGEILLIHNITRYCDGLYECVASNGVGDAVSKEINIDVQFPPEVHLLTKKISQKIGKETILSCMISASPQAISVWHKNGQKIETNWKTRSVVYEESPHTISLNLRIMNIEEQDYGFYTCEASNKLGGDSERMLLYEEKPKLTTTAYHTEESTTNPRIPEHRKHIQSSKHQFPPDQDKRGNHQNIPKGPVYHSENNGAFSVLENIYLLHVLLIASLVSLEAKL